MVKVLIAAQENVILDRFVEGYCEVFYRTQKQTNAKFAFNEEVTSVVTRGFSQIDVFTNKNKYHFDTIIFALRPQDLVKLNISSNSFNNFARIFYQVQLIQANGKIDVTQKLAPNSNEVSIVLDPTFGTTQVDLTGHLGGIVAPFVDAHPDKLVLVGNSQTQSGFTPNIAADLQKFLGFETQQLYFNRIFDEGPNYLTESDIGPFYKWIETQQGNPQTGFYFVGEYLAGHGVPENFHYSLQFAQQYFFNLPTSQRRYAYGALQPH